MPIAITAITARYVWMFVSFSVIEPSSCSKGYYDWIKRVVGESMRIDRTLSPKLLGPQSARVRRSVGIRWPSLCRIRFVAMVTVVGCFAIMMMPSVDGQFCVSNIDRAGFEQSTNTRWKGAFREPTKRAYEAYEDYSKSSKPYFPMGLIEKKARDLLNKVLFSTK